MVSLIRGASQVIGWQNMRANWKRLIVMALQVFGVIAGIGADTNLKPGTAISANEYRRFALLKEGDPRRGQAIFTAEQKVICAKCHTVDGSAAKAGPDLFAIGDKFGRREIIDAILLPSQTIAEGYAAITIETRSGDEYTGIVKQASSLGIALMGADAKLVRIDLSDVARQRVSVVSLMPEGLQAGLTLEEFTDLVEYLVSLKQPANVNSVQQGMPAVIEPLAKPVTFRPFHSEELRFEHPVWFGPIPGQSNAFLVVEHETGNIWRLEKNPRGDTKTLFVNLETFMKGTRGLLGMAFHPRFTENHKYYYAKHFAEGTRFATYIFERRADPEGKADSDLPARLIMHLENLTGVHYGGGLQFGPDGYFYIGMGDTGPQEDPEGHGQNTNLLLGKMLRIDVDHARGSLPYAIPPDNPFLNRSDIRPEIWAIGFREPWRFSFDPLTGDLWVGDVGQDRYEEVDLVRAGENYGWNVYEGFEPFSNRYRREGVRYVPPVFAYARKFGVSVTGGWVYRANPRSSFYGVYIFGDYQSRRIFGLTQKERVLQKIRELCVAPERVVSFGRDHQGQLYVVGYEGMIYKIELDGGAAFQ